MSYQPKILAFAGSARTGSYNKKLVQVAAMGATAMRAKVTYIDFKDFVMPLYDADLEAKSGIPDSVKSFKKLMIESDGFLISSPENNSSISALLKNVIDWASRPEEGQPTLAAFDGKLAGIMSASPGALGGLRGLVHLRAILESIRVMVLPDQRAVSKAHEAFDENDILTDDKTRTAIEAIGGKLAVTIAKLKA